MRPPVVKGDKVLDCREAVDVVDLIENDQGQDLADARHRAQPHQGFAIMLFGGTNDMKFHRGQELSVMPDQLKVEFDASLHAGIAESLGHAFAIFLGGDLFLPISGRLY
jgi:hypothetical protein